VNTDPPITECVNRIIAKPPRSKHEASTVFGYMSSRLAEIGQNNVAKLQNARIVPVGPLRRTENGFADEKAGSGELRYLPPGQCYLGTSPTYSEVFDFVDFGAEANSFLLKCGSKLEPSKLELASMISKEPARLLGIMQGSEKYLTVLRTLAEDMATLKRDKALWKQMKASKFLLGSVEMSANNAHKKSSAQEDGNDSDDDPENPPIKQYHLAAASQIVIVSVK
jgi:hypothetical protein